MLGCDLCEGFGCDICEGVTSVWVVVVTWI